MKEGAAPSSTVTSASVKSASKSHEQQSTAAPPPASMSETNGSGINTNEGSNNQENEGPTPYLKHFVYWFRLCVYHTRCIDMFSCLWTAEGYSIYLKGLASNTTPALLENEFKKFGPIKSGGIQVRTQKVFYILIPCLFLSAGSEYFMTYYWV